MKTTRQAQLFWLACALFAAIAAPIVISTLWAMPFADEFSISNMVRGFSTQNNANALSAIASLVRSTYMTWTGCYANNILHGLFPLYKIGFGGLRAVLFFNAVLFFLSMFLMVRSVFIHVLKCENRAYIMFACAGLAALTTQFSSLADVFLWIAGAFNYTFMLSAFMLSIALAPIAISGTNRHKRTIAFVLSVLALVFACGGTLVVSSGVCTVYLCIMIYFALKRARREGLTSAGLFLVCFIASLINAIAPGNFARRDVLAAGSSFSVFTAVKEALKLCCSNVVSYVTQSPVAPIAVMLAVCVAIPVFLGRNIELPYAGLGLLASAVLYFASVFPYMLAAPGQNPPARVYFIYFFFFSLSLVFAAFCITGLIVSKAKCRAVSNTVKAAVFVLMLSLAALTFEATPPRVYRSVAYSSALINGELQVFAEQYNELLSEIANYDGENVRVINKVTQCDLAPILTLDANPEFWANTAIAEYYNKKTLSVVNSE